MAMIPKFIVWKADASGLIDQENLAWGQFTGQSEQAYRGAGWLDAVHPDDREPTRAQWHATVQAGTAWEFRFRLRRADGVYRHMASQGGPLLEGGEVVAWAGICNDMTDALRADARRQAIEARLSFLDELGEATRHLSEADAVMATVSRLLGQHLGVTRCAYADVEPDGDRFTIRHDWSAPGVPSSAGSYSLTLFGPQAVHRLRRGQHLVVNDVDGELGDEGGARMFKAIGIRAVICAGLVKDQRLVAMMAVHQAVPRPWSEDDIALVGEVVDRCWSHIERVRDNAKLREQDRRKDDFLATLAHELRNPLAPIRNAAALLRRGTSADRHQQMIEVIERQAGHLTRLVDDLLEVSRIHRGLIRLQTAPVPLRALLEQAVETVAPQLQAAGHRLELKLPPATCLVEADVTRMVQVIANLLHNAIKYTPGRGVVSLRAWAEEGQALVEVADNGVGIPPEDQVRLFELFTQLPHTAGRAQGGLGIGLSLVKRLVDLHGGQVRVHSGGLGQGSRFVVQLPAGTAAALEPGPADPVPGAVAGSDILVVEDNPDGREVLVALLEDMGYAVRAAGDGPAGLQLAQERAPWLVLLDLGLPGIDGYEVARRLRAQAQTARATIVALTGWGAEQDRERTAAAGFDAHFTKPYDPEDLERFLARLAAERAAG